MSDSSDVYIKMKLPKPEVHRTHPFVDANSHARLLTYVEYRLEKGKMDRDMRINRMIETDRMVAGWLQLSDEDKKRKRKRDKTGQPIATSMNLPVTYVHLDDMVTFLLGVFAPSKGMFDQFGSPKEESAASQVVSLMNNHAKHAGYFREVALMCAQLLKYNIAGFTAVWKEELGAKVKQTPDRKVAVSQEVIWQGNSVQALDMYNTIWDPSVSPAHVYKDGEFAATAHIKTHYWLQREALNGVYFNCEKVLECDPTATVGKYYRHPPSEALLSNRLLSNGVDHRAALSGQDSLGQPMGYELVRCYIRLNPIHFDLVPPNQRKQRDRYEIWRITIANGDTIIACDYMNNVHDNIPIYVSQATDDNMEEAQKSIAEIIAPLQDFASFLMNTHVQASRKNIWGLTVYDPTVVDLSKIPEGEVSAKVAAKQEAAGKDLRTAIWQNTHVLDTRQTMNDVQAVMNLLGQFFPTQMLPSQIAGMDRAVNSQVAAVMHGATRRMTKMARIIDESIFRPLRHSLYYNILQYQPDGQTIADFYGKPVKIDLGALRESDMPYIIGQGLQSVDKLAAVENLERIIFALVQNPQTAQRFDLAGLMNYWTDLFGVNVDLNQFAIQQPAAPAAGQDDPNAAAAAEAAAAAAGGTPA